MPGVPNTFANASGSIPLSQLDANFNTTLTIGTTSVGLGNTISTISNVAISTGSVNGSPVGNVTPSSGAFTTLSATGNVTVADGTVSVPAIAFTSDTDSGLYRIGANNIGVAVNGAKVLDVGVAGVTSPGYLYGIGSVVQVVFGSTTTTLNTTSSTYADTNLTATITPKFNTSKILILVMQNTYITRASDNAQVGYLQLQRNGTAILTQSDLGPYVQAAANVADAGVIPLTYVDSPASTSALTYKTQARVTPTSNGSQLITQLNNTPSTIVLMEIGA